MSISLTQRKIRSKAGLRKAVTLLGPVRNGWPDAGIIEQKIACDGVSADQWRRAAWAHVEKSIFFQLLFADTHEDALYPTKRRIISFEDYAQELGMFDTWKRLVQMQEDAEIRARMNEDVPARG